MKNRKQLFLIAGFLLTTHCFVLAQPGKIGLQHSNAVTTFTDLTAALAASVNGDTLYLPGGTVFASNPTVTINKGLTIIGAGHYPDSTTATYQTIIPGTIFIVTGADGGLLTGVKCNELRFGTSVATQNVNNFRITRCNITGQFYPSFSGLSTSQNILISECIINNCSSWSGNYFASVLFEKDIIYVTASTPYGGTGLFNNCIFYNTYSTFFNNSAANVLNNCIVIHSASNSLTIGGSATITNNLLVSYVSPTNPVISYNGVINNPITKELTSSTFINANTTSFSYANNYHLLQSSHGHNAGTDGTDVGLYGTMIPYKESAVPFNPHISSKTIGSTTNTTGTLNVDIKVSAQDR